MPITASAIRPKPIVNKPEPESANEADDTRPSAKPLVPGSVIAKILAAVWAGAPITIVDAPPGSGKTASVVNLVAHLTEHAGLRVLVQVVTRNQGVALAHRLVEQIDPTFIEIGIKKLPPGSLPAGVYSGGSVSPTKPRVTVKTVASCAIGMPTYCDVIVVDEAYQAVYADIALGTAHVPQIVCVGDPGQIGPIVTIDTSIWQNLPSAPHRPAPEVLAGLKGARRFSLDRTWRLGHASAKAIAPLYNFPFSSAGVKRSLVADGNTDAQRHYGEIEAIQVPDASGPDDIVVMSAVVDRVAELMTTKLLWQSPDGEDQSRSTDASDIAVVVSRNSQVSIVEGILAARQIVGVTVHTADRIQGAEYPIVVALDPAVGADGVSDHAMSNGRLCVMASRHTTHLSWIHDSRWRSVMAGRATASMKGRAVREALTEHSIRTDAGHVN